MSEELGYQLDYYSVGECIRIGGNTLNIMSIENGQVTFEVDGPEGIAVEPIEAVPH